MDKDKQARLEAKGWRFGDADEFLGADAGQLEVDETYKTDNVEALVAENARLKAEVAAANKGAQVNALVSESLAKKLKLAVEALSDARSHLFAIYNGDWPSDISPTPAGFAQFAVNDIDATLAKIKEPSKGGEQR